MYGLNIEIIDVPLSMYVMLIMLGWLYRTDCRRSSTKHTYRKHKH